MRLLLVARRFNPSFPYAVGGVIVSSENLILALDSQKIDYEVVDTNKLTYLSQFVAWIVLIFRILLRIPKNDHLALNLNESELIYVAPLVTWIAKLLGKSCSLRIFGGNLDTFLASRNSLEKLMFKAALSNVQAIFLQTKRLASDFEIKGKTHWLPTCREAARGGIKNPFKRRFVYFGHIRKEKGIHDILAASQLIGAEYRIDFYGQLIGVTHAEFNGVTCCYMGVLKREEVQQAISEYDVLLLPSYWRGEGYPGVIVEAFSVGVPVVVSNLKNLVEMVTDGDNGFIVPAKDPKSLADAMMKFDENNYPDFSANARKSFAHYDCEKVYGNYIEILREICARMES